MKRLDHERGPYIMRPCPFCGSSDIDPEEWASMETSGPGCAKCGAGAGSVHRTPEENIEAWNSRIPEWQTIESAPFGNDTDGPFFDVAWAGDNRRVIGCYKCEQHGGAIMLCHGYPAVWTVFMPQPTHWMPEPVLPVSAVEGGS